MTAEYQTKTTEYLKVSASSGEISGQHRQADTLTTGSERRAHHWSLLRRLRGQGNGAEQAGEQVVHLSCLRRYPDAQTEILLLGTARAYGLVRFLFGFLDRKKNLYPTPLYRDLWQDHPF